MNDKTKFSDEYRQAEKHLAEMRERFRKEQNMDKQEEHWESNERHWRWITVISVFAIIANAAARIWGPTNP